MLNPLGEGVSRRILCRKDLEEDSELKRVVFLVSTLLVLPLSSIVRQIRIGAVPDNYAMKSVAHCFIWASCSFGLGLLKRHSHSLRKRAKCSLGMPLKRRK